MSFSWEERREHLKKMSAVTLDILIIGGGITGAGISLDAISRGLGVGLVEMGDFASGTSSRSTKLVHGGLRYLKQFEVKTVAEVGRERTIVYENAPHVTTPVKMVLPFYQDGSFGPFTTAIGLDLYDKLAQVDKHERKFMLRARDTLRREPYLKAEGLKGSGVYVEYRTDDSRLTLEVLKKAEEFGAYIANYAKVEKLLYSKETGKVIGVRVRDLIDNIEYPIYAKRVINAAGPWVDHIREMDHSKEDKYLHLTKGVHLVFDDDRLPLSNAVYFDTPFEDDRMMFAIPREGKVYVGTTDTFYKDSPADVTVTLDDVTYILDAINIMFAIPPMTVADIESAWAGVRPLIHEDSKDPSEISRKDEIFHSESGLYSIAGGKLTGYRHMSKEIVDKVLHDICKEYKRLFIKCRTKNLNLSGGDVGGSQGYQRYVKEFVKIGIEKFHLTHRESNLLVKRYGSNVIDLFAYLLNVPESSQLSDVDYVMLRYALEHEMCLHPIDFLLRRTSYMLFNMARCQTIKEEVVAEMGKFYQWTEEYQEKMLAETNQEIDKHLIFTE